MYKKKHSRIDRVTKKRRRKLGKRLFITTLIIGLGILIYVLIQLWGTLTGSHDNLGKSNLRENQVDLNKDPFAVLLIGSDARKESSHNWRPDVLMIAAINPKKKSMKLVSIPRDTWVEIANTNGGKSKINHSAYYGYTHGIDPIQNIRQTVENFLHIPIDHYAKVNFNGFMDVVDILGGVDVNVKRAFTIKSFGGEKLHFELGPQHLNGEQALAYSRMRKQDPLGDKGRNIRQHEVLAEIMKKMVSFKAASQFLDLSKKVGKNVSYSINPTDILSLFAIYDNIPKQNIETLTFKTTNDRLEGQLVQIISDAEQQRISQILQQQLKWAPKDTPSNSNQPSESESEDPEETVSTQN